MLSTIVPCIREFYLEESANTPKIALIGSVEDYAYTPFLPENHFGIFYLKDQLDMFSFLTKDEIPEGITMSELHKIACENLEKLAEVEIYPLLDPEEGEGEYQAYIEKNRLFVYSFNTNIEDHGCLFNLDSYLQKILELFKGNFYIIMSYNSAAVIAENCAPYYFERAINSAVDEFYDSEFSVSLQILKYDTSTKRFEVCGNVETYKPCPICSTPIPRDEVYPNQICGHCVAKATDEKGRRIFFSNVIMGMGLKIHNEDGEACATPYCLVSNHLCKASEHRYYGGVVVETLE